MNSLNTATVSLAVTPTVISTFFSHYLNRGPLRQKPTAHLPYNEGLHLVRAFIEFSSNHTVEDLQAFTAQWVPHPQWVKVIDVTIPDAHLDRAASLLQDQLGQDGIQMVGGRKWWQWRKPNSPLTAEWIEMREDYNERKKNGDPGKRVMYYVHGGAYYFGSVDEHRYQLQRHARKLKARVFAPEYRLAPQFPFPCGLQDCLAGYLYLLTVQEPSTIVLAGDSAGAGMIVSTMVTLRDRGLPLPAGAVLISPWVDLTHSFPSMAAEQPMDFIPAAGFHHKPSRAWPPPNEDDIEMMREQVGKLKGKGKGAVKRELPVENRHSLVQEAKDEEDKEEGPVDRSDPPHGVLEIAINGKTVLVKDQIQMYTTNNLLCHPLVSPVKQATLGGLPPLLIMVGGGERLRDEQIYMAHKCANPKKYAPPEESLTDTAKAQLKQYKPTDVQLQVWDDLCHVAPCLSFTRPAKYMYRSIAQFSAWALARAQNTGIDILDDDAISIISSSGSDEDGLEKGKREKAKKSDEEEEPPVIGEPKSGAVGKAGDPLPPFRSHMIRQCVTRHGNILPLDPEAELAGCTVKPCDIGVVREEVVAKWLETKQTSDKRYAREKAKIYKKMVKDMASGYLEFGDGEDPPPSALAGRRQSPSALTETKKKKSLGLSLWSLWGSKHDQKTVAREQKADASPETKSATAEEGTGARSFPDLERQDPAPMFDDQTHTRSRRRTVVDENQTGGGGASNAPDRTLVEELIRQRKVAEAENKARPEEEQTPDTGIEGKRPMIDGIAVPFSLKKEPDSASLVTLHSTGGVTSPVSPMAVVVVKDETAEDTNGEVEHHGKHPVIEGGLSVPFAVRKEAETASMVTLSSNLSGPQAVPAMQPVDSMMDDAASTDTEKGPERPPMETFVTAAEELPTIGKDEA